jgi:hypothetical protein
MHFFRLRLVAALLVGITLISVGSTYFDVLAHKHNLRSDLARRTQWFGAGAQPQIEQQMSAGQPEGLSRLLQRLRQYPDQPSMAVYDTHGDLLAATGDILPLKSLPANFLRRPLNEGKEAAAFVKAAENQRPAPTNSAADGNRAQSSATARLWYEDAIPLHDGQETIGTLVMVADADYIRLDGMQVWRRSFLNIVALVILVVVVTLLMVRWFLLQPVTRAAEWLRRLRQGKAEVGDGAKEFGYLVPLAKLRPGCATPLSMFGQRIDWPCMCVNGWATANSSWSRTVNLTCTFGKEPGLNVWSRPAAWSPRWNLFCKPATALGLRMAAAVKTLRLWMQTIGCAFLPMSRAIRCAACG